MAIVKSMLKHENVVNDVESTNVFEWVCFFLFVFRRFDVFFFACIFRNEKRMDLDRRRVSRDE